MLTKTKLTLSLLFITAISFCQSIEAIEIRIDSLNNELSIIEKQFEKQKSNINSQIKDLTTQRKDIMKQKQLEQGVPTKVSVSGAKLRLKPEVSAAVVLELPPNTEILLFDFYQKPFFKAEYDGHIGYVSYGSLRRNDFIKSKIDKVTDNSRLGVLSRKYSKPIAQDIIKGKYWIGMTLDMARESLGNPDDTSKITTRGLIIEQWFYWSKSITLSFENGKLESFLE